MRQVFSLILLLVFSLFFSPNLQAFLRPKLSFSFQPTSQILFGTANDAYGFKLSADYDDLRSASVFLSYLFPQDLPFSLETSLHMLTYRGYKKDPEYLRKRSESLDITLLYHFPSSMVKPAFGELYLNLGTHFFASGDFGGVYLQKIIHKIIGVGRPLPLYQDPFVADIFMVWGWKYLWRETLIQQGEIHISPLGSYFFRTSLGFVSNSSFITSQAHLYWQYTILTQQQSSLGNNQKSILQRVADAENGLGLTYSFESDYVFFFQEAKLFPLHSESNSSMPLDLFSLGGIGFKIPQNSSQDPHQKLKIDQLNKKIPSSGISLRAMRFGWEYPFGFTYSWLWQHPSLSNFNLQSGFTFNNEGNNQDNLQRINRLFINANLDFLKYDKWNFFASTGFHLTLNQIFDSDYEVWRPNFQQHSLSFGLQIETGMWIEFEKTSQARYRLVIYNHLHYPLVNMTLSEPTLFLKKRFLFKPLAIALEIGSL